MTPSGLQSGPLDPESIALATRPPRLPQLVNLGEVFPFQYFLRHGLFSLANTMTIAFVRSRHSDSQGRVEDKRGRYSLSPRESSHACRLRARIARALRPSGANRPNTRKTLQFKTRRNKCLRFDFFLYLVPSLLADPVFKWYVKSLSPGTTVQSVYARGNSTSRNTSQIKTFIVMAVICDKNSTKYL